MQLLMTAKGLTGWGQSLVSIGVDWVTQVVDGNWDYYIIRRVCLAPLQCDRFGYPRGE
jgi:hypothetical protein